MLSKEEIVEFCQDGIPPEKREAFINTFGSLTRNDINRTTCISMAAWNGRIEVIDTIINIPGIHGGFLYTPAIIAAQHQEYKCFDRLLGELVVDFDYYATVVLVKTLNIGCNLIDPILIRTVLKFQDQLFQVLTEWAGALWVEIGPDETVRDWFLCCPEDYLADRDVHTLNCLKTINNVQSWLKTNRNKFDTGIVSGLDGFLEAFDQIVDIRQVNDFD